MAKHPSEERERALNGLDKAIIREDILQSFPRLFGTKTINGRKVNVEQEIAALVQELHPEIAAALTARQSLLHSPAPVREKYAWPKWNDTFEDPVTEQFWTYRQIVQGLIDNFLGRDSEWRWRLNDEAPVIMEILKRQLLSPRYVQHSARVLFVLAPANEKERVQLLEAIFTLSRKEVVKRVHEGTLNKSALDAHDYVYDIFPGIEGK